MRPLREPRLVLGATLSIVPPALLHFFASEQVAFGSAAHFFPVALSASAATACAIALTIAGARHGDGRTVVIATAFSVMAALLVVHGVATPGFLFGMNGVVAFSGAATLPVGGVLLALCTIPGLRGPRAVRPLLWLQGGLLAAVAALGVSGAAAPGLVPGVPEARSAPALAALGLGIAFYAVVGWRSLRTYRLTRRLADGLVPVGVVWLAASLAAALLLDYSQLGWWLGHGLEVLGIAAIGLPVALDLRRSSQSRALHGDLSACELVANEEAFLGAQVHGLVGTLAERDVSTGEHTRRVALRAVQVGEELALSPERLRILATGGLLHDVGKLRVPDAILKKPAALTDEEYEIVKRHPEWGRRLVSELGFPEAVARLVHDHHERVDGTGYPRGLGGAGLDLETRILGTCDVYDALVSTRVYRDAWSHSRAIAYLRERAGTGFDAGCVAALERVLAREQADLLPIAV